MSGIRRAHRGSERQSITHFSDHDDVWILAEHMLECVVKGKGVQAYFALFDDRLVVLKDKLDRVFESDHVFFEIGVNVLDHRGQRGGFAAAGGAGHQHDASRRFRDLFDLLQEAQLFKAWHNRLHIAHRQTPLPSLLQEVRSESAIDWNEV